MHAKIVGIVCLLRIRIFKHHKVWYGILTFVFGNALGNT